MGDEGPKLDQLKLIPQVFFDLIARVVPGAIGIVAALLLSKTTLESWLRDALGERLASSSSLGAAVIFLAAAYVVGQVLSPLAKGVQRLGELRWFKPEPKAEGFDWLRLHHPAAGDQCAKIRAEFTMHNSFVVVLLVSAIVYPLRDGSWQWPVLVALSVGALLAGIRGRTTRDTFNKTVAKFVEAAREGTLVRPKAAEFDRSPAKHTNAR